MTGPMPDYGRLTAFLCDASLEQLLREGPALAKIIPELGATLDFDQHSPHHAYDLYTHIAHVVAAVPGEPVLRWAALLHDIGKPVTFTRDAAGRGHFREHASRGASMAKEILTRLGAAEEVLRTVPRLIASHMEYPLPAGLTPEEDRLLRLLQQGDMAGKGR